MSEPPENAESPQGGPPLEGLRVLDLSRVLAGPWCGQLLADLGAEVIKVERPGAGDDTRGWGPPWLKDPEGNETDIAAYFLSANRGKKSIALDIATEAGQRTLKALAARSDILLENYKVGGLAKYGLDHASLRSVNPRLIYCSITGFGQTGPMAGRAGYDVLIQAMGGLMSITGKPDEVPGGGPQKVGVALADILTGMYATAAVLAAVQARHRTGRGQHIDLALLDVQAAVLANQNMNYLVTGKAPGRMGNAHPNIVPYQDFHAQDGWLILAVGNDEQFRRFCEVAGRPELGLDPLFATNRDRVHNRAALIPLLEALFRERPRDWWIGKLEAAHVPCGPINNVAEALNSPQIQARGLPIHLDHPELGRVPLVGCPIRFSETPVRYDLAPPRLGEHDDLIAEFSGDQ